MKATFEVGLQDKEEACEAGDNDAEVGRQQEDAYVLIAIVPESVVGAPQARREVWGVVKRQG